MAEIRILVTGKEGQVARCLEDRAAAASIALAKIGRPEMDMAAPGTVRAAMAAAIAAFAPTIIVNAAAYTAVDQAEDEPEQAFAINAESAGEVAAAAADAGLPVIQISTDYVFDGTKDAPYTEDNTPNPQSVYGASKLAGEQAVCAANPQHLIFRTAWVQSPYGKNFVKTMLKLAETRDELSVVADQFGNPTSAYDIADGILAAARRNEADAAKVLWGTYHLAGTDATHWAGFAEEIFRLSAARGGAVAKINHITTDQYSTKAKRPANSVLECGAFEIAFGWRARQWQAGLWETVAMVVRETPIHVSKELITEPDTHVPTAEATPELAATELLTEPLSPEFDGPVESVAAMEKIAP